MILPLFKKYKILPVYCLPFAYEYFWLLVFTHFVCVFSFFSSFINV